MKKIFVSLFLVLSMSAQSFLIYANNTTIASDAVMAKGFLSALGILKEYEETGEWDNEPLPRGEAAAFAVRMVGMEEISATCKSKEYFKDVLPNSLNAQYINCAYEADLMVGENTGEFKPEEGITYGQFLTVIVKVLGYKPAAEQNGGYPTGYIGMASELKLGIKGKGYDDYISRIEEIALVAEALEIEIMQMWDMLTAGLLIKEAIKIYWKKFLIYPLLMELWMPMMIQAFILFPQKQIMKICPLMV